MFEHALADEILAEVARQRRTSKSVQDESGVRARAWSNYLTTRNRHLPMPAVVAICDALGVKPSEMLRRAEDRVAQLNAQHGAGPRVDVDKILAESPELAAVRAEGQRVTARRTTSSD